MRALIFELRPESLEADGLVISISRKIEAVRARLGIAAQAITSEEPEAPLEVKEALYRIAQEALQNMVKHAHPRRVDVNLKTRRNTVALEIADDGAGFDTAVAFPGHLCLQSMRERALEVGAPSKS